MTRSEAEALLTTLLRRDVDRAAQGNRWVSRQEQRALPPALDALAERIRVENGPGSRVRTDVLVARATAVMLATLAGDDGVRAWFETFDFATRRFSVESLPEGGRVDARQGQPGRDVVPAGVLAAFDFWYRVEQADIGSVSLHHGVVAGREIWAVYTSNDGDQAALEVLDPSGATLHGATLLEGRIVAWDQFAGQVRLAAWVLALDPPTLEDGMSEPDERAEAGQVPLDYTGDATLEAGTLRGESDLLLDLELLEPVDHETQARLFAAFSYLWSVHLRFRAEDGRTPLPGNGFLRYGSFVRPTTGVAYWVADWRDIDDGSYVLYFEAEAPRPVLSIVQFDN